MVSRSARMKEKGQITIPAQIRKSHDLSAGSRVIFEDRGGYIALIPESELVDRTAGALSSHAQKLGRMTPSQLQERAAKSIAAENVETLRQIERDHANN